MHRHLKVKRLPICSYRCIFTSVYSPFVHISLSCFYTSALLIWISSPLCSYKRTLNWCLLPLCVLAHVKLMSSPFVRSLAHNNYIISVFHWHVTIWLAMKWSHDYKRDVLHPNKTQTELTRASMTTSDVNNQWRSNFQQQII